MKHDYTLVEKKNRLVIHGIFMSRERAEKHLKENIPDYCKRGFFMDKTLCPDDFEILSPSVTWKPRSLNL